MLPPVKGVLHLFWVDDGNGAVARNSLLPPVGGVLHFFWVDDGDGAVAC